MSEKLKQDIVTDVVFLTGIIVSLYAYLVDPIWMFVGIPLKASHS